MTHRHAAEFRRCLVDLDVRGARRLWAAVSPHLPQPADDGAALLTMHAARVEMRTLPKALRDYSRDWLAERKIGRVVLAVGISINAPAYRQAQANAIRHEMSEAVTGALRDGVDLATEAAEIKRRMMRARDRA